MKIKCNSFNLERAVLLPFAPVHLNIASCINAVSKA